MNKLTMEQAVIISMYTGYLICPFDEMHKEIEKRMGRPVWTHEMGSESFMESLRSIVKDDFIAMGPEVEK